MTARIRQALRAIGFRIIYFCEDRPRLRAEQLASDRVAKGTWVLAIATVVLALATVALIFATLAD